VKQQLNIDQLGERTFLQGRPQILMRDLFAVANLLVSLHRQFFLVIKLPFYLYFFLKPTCTWRHYNVPKLLCQLHGLRIWLSVVHDVITSNEKKRSERRKHCALAVVRRSQKFSPRRRPLPGSAGRPKFNQLEMVTTVTYKPSLARIDARNFELSW